MNTAIDIYKYGKEVNASDFNGITIRANTGRFYCPICYETVALTKSGVFRHKVETEKNKECERRVNNNLGSAYEKQGIPLFIKQVKEFVFEMFLGFPAQKSDLLTLCAVQQSILKISGASQIIYKYKINEEIFSSEMITYLPVRTLPINGIYNISYSDNTPSEILKRWTPYTDKWGNGRFFKWSENYCKKVRYGGTIVTNEYYYFSGAINKLKKYSLFIEIEKCGYVLLDTIEQDRLCIYKILIKGTYFEEPHFKEMERELFLNFKINIAEKESCLKPLWPPCKTVDDGFLYNQSVNEAAFFINSPNDNPKVIHYGENKYEYVNDIFTKPAIFSTKVNEDDAFSVDRAFNGNIHFIHKANRINEIVPLKAFIVDANEKIVSSELKSIKNCRFYCKTNFKGYAIILKKDGGQIQYRISDENGIELKNIFWGDRVIVYTNSWGMILDYTFEKRKNNNRNSDEADIIEFLKLCRGSEIPISSKIIALLSRINDSSVRAFVLKYIKNGKIPQSARNILIKYYGGN